MNEPRKILEFSVAYDEFPKFMRDVRGIMISEIVAAAEELLYCNLENVTVCKILIKKSAGNVVIECKLTLSDIIKDMDDLLNWTVEREEYELSHRIKLLGDYIKKNNLKIDDSVVVTQKNLYKIIE